MSNVVGLVLAKLSALSGAQFARFTYVAKTSGEVAEHTVILNFDVRTVYEKDIATLETLRPTLSGLDLQACDEILASLAVSLEGGIGDNPAYTHSADARGEGNETYINIPGLRGVSIHRETGEVYVKGLAESKRVIVEGEHKEVKSRPLTIAKRQLDKGLRRGKIRQFALGHLVSARINGDTLELATTAAEA